MPVKVEVDRSRKLVVTSYSGEVTDADVRQQVSEVHRLAPYDADYRAITDFTHAAQFNISTDQIKDVAERDSPLSEARRVIVAPSDIAYGTLRMFQSLSSSTRPNIMVVRSLTEAYATLDIEPEAQGNRQKSARD